MLTPKTFNNPFRYAPHPYIKEAAELLISQIQENAEWESVLSEGKMLGVLWVEKSLTADKNGEDSQTQLLYGFSGLVGGKAHLPGFVPPIFDLTDPQGYFKQEEAQIVRLNERIKESEDALTIAQLKQERKARSVALQEWIFQQYKVLNARGERSSIAEIFADKGLVPPGGTGDCALPKLLQYAYLNDMKPLACGEFWYGTSPTQEPRIQGHFYPSCTGKCGPLLEFMLQGLELEHELEKHEYRICYQDEWLIVADKPSGMLSVPGKTGQESLHERMEKQFSQTLYACHRLDMDTRGLIVFAKDILTQKAIQRQFENRQTQKSYLATLTAGAPIKDKGEIMLPLMPDYYERPRQKVDFKQGKSAHTLYEVIENTAEGECLVRLTPLTGRTHQLRVHCAHPQGLGRPIKGDFLYGGVQSKPEFCEHPTLQLTADYLAFEHPATHEKIEFKL